MTLIPLHIHIKFVGFPVLYFASPHPTPSLPTQDELKLQAHQVLCRLCILFPTAVLGSVDSLIEPIEKAVSKKINKEGIVGPEVFTPNSPTLPLFVFFLIFFIFIFYNFF